MSAPNDPGMDYPETDHPQYDERPARSRFLPACVGCFAGTLAFFLILLAIGWYSMGAFVKFGIASDLAEYSELIAKSSVSEEQKKTALDQIGRLKKLNDEGNGPNFWQWVTYKERIDKKTKEGQITEEDIKDVIGYLKAMEPKPDG